LQEKSCIAPEGDAGKGDAPGENAPSDPVLRHAASNLDHEIAAEKGTQHHDQRRQPANDAGMGEKRDADQRDESDGGVADGIGLVDVVMAEHRIDGEKHDARAEAEITAIGIDDEFEKEGQPDPAPAIEIMLLLEPALDRGVLERKPWSRR
jgi:hypothetical protein